MQQRTLETGDKAKRARQAKRPDCGSHFAVGAEKIKVTAPTMRSTVTLERAQNLLR